MENDIKEVQAKIDKARKEMDLAIENNEDYSKIYEKSIYIDKIILEYLDKEKKLNVERSKLMDKYNNLIETPFKNEIIGQIRSEVRLKYPSMGIEELLHFSTNVYIYATLIVHNIPEQEIVNQLMFLNNKFFNATQNDDEIIINREMEQPTLEYLKYLKEKYVKIIRERI